MLDRKHEALGVKNQTRLEFDPLFLCRAILCPQNPQCNKPPPYTHLMYDRQGPGLLALTKDLSVTVISDGGLSLQRPWDGSVVNTCAFQKLRTKTRKQLSFGGENRVFIFMPTLP